MFAVFLLAEGFWPLTSGGVLGLILSVITLVSLLFGFFKGLNHLNGLGGRVTKVERHQTAYDLDAANRAIAAERTANLLVALAEKIGGANTFALECRSDTDKMSRELGARIDTAITKMDAVTNGLNGLKIELRARNIIGVPQKEDEI